MKKKKYKNHKKDQDLFTIGFVIFIIMVAIVLLLYYTRQENLLKEQQQNELQDKLLVCFIAPEERNCICSSKNLELCSITWRKAYEFKGGNYGKKEY